MVRKRIILLRVQNLEQRGGRIAPEIRADLVHFIQDKDRVVAPGPAHALDDAPRERAHVSAAVAPDFRLVPHASQGEAHEFAAQSPGDGAAQGGLAGAGRTHEAENGAFHIGF
jgi:hypothetical protein